MDKIVELEERIQFLEEGYADFIKIMGKMLDAIEDVLNNLASQDEISNIEK